MYDIELIDGQPQATRDIGKDESVSVSPEAWEVLRNQRGFFPSGIVLCETVTPDPMTVYGGQDLGARGE